MVRAVGTNRRAVSTIRESRSCSATSTTSTTCSSVRTSLRSAYAVPIFGRTASCRCCASSSRSSHPHPNRPMCPPPVLSCSRRSAHPRRANGRPMTDPVVSNAPGGNSDGCGPTGPTTSSGSSRRCRRRTSRIVRSRRASSLTPTLTRRARRGNGFSTIPAEASGARRSTRWTTRNGRLCGRSWNGRCEIPTPGSAGRRSADWSESGSSRVAARSRRWHRIPTSGSGSKTAAALRRAE